MIMIRLSDNAYPQISRRSEAVWRLKALALRVRLVLEARPNRRAG